VLLAWPHPPGAAAEAAALLLLPLCPAQLAPSPDWMWGLLLLVMCSAQLAAVVDLISGELLVVLSSDQLAAVVDLICDELPLGLSSAQLAPTGCLLMPVLLGSWPGLPHAAAPHLPRCLLVQHRRSCCYAP
jgi:hypothetical protein